MEHIKQVAREFLIRQKIGKMRLDLGDLTDLCARLDVSVMSYSQGQEIITKYHLESCCTRPGFIYACHDIDIIFYADSLPLGERGIVVAHELGHIQLMQSSFSASNGGEKNEWTAAQEAEAWAFAYEILAPLVVLKKCGVTNIASVKRLTGLSGTHAEHVLAMLSGFKPSIADVELTAQYAEFIRKNKRRVASTPILVAASVVLAGGILLLPWSERFDSDSVPSYPIVTQEAIQTTSTFPSASAAITTLPPFDESSAGQYVFVTMDGTKYHREDCYHIANSDSVKEFLVETVMEMGYIPCKTCRPDEK